jgi:DNA-binding response OmpR family regulator
MKPRILVIDDEAGIRDSMRMILEYEGYECLLAATGPEGLALAEREAPDLVLLDLMLPGLDGLEVCRRLQGDGTTASISIVMVTAKGEESDKVRGLRLGSRALRSS